MIRLTLLTIALASPSFGQASCDMRDTMVAMLENKYGETRRASGLNQAGAVEMWASATGSWTLTITTPDGVTCLIASGEAYAADPGGVAG